MMAVLFTTKRCIHAIYAHVWTTALVVNSTLQPPRFGRHVSVVMLRQTITNTARGLVPLFLLSTAYAQDGTPTSIPYQIHEPKQAVTTRAKPSHYKYYAYRKRRAYRVWRKIIQADGPKPEVWHLIFNPVIPSTLYTQLLRREDLWP